MKISMNERPLPNYFVHRYRGNAMESFNKYKQSFPKDIANEILGKNTTNTKQNKSHIQNTNHKNSKKRSNSNHENTKKTKQKYKENLISKKNMQIYKYVYKIAITFIFFNTQKK